MCFIKLLRVRWTQRIMNSPIGTPSLGSKSVVNSAACQALAETDLMALMSCWRSFFSTQRVRLWCVKTWQYTVLCPHPSHSTGRHSHSSTCSANSLRRTFFLQPCDTCRQLTGAWGHTSATWSGSSPSLHTWKTMMPGHISQGGNFW